jgi:polar amino acid transport system substrate-binding protein
MKLGFRRMAVLFGVLALVAASCGGDETSNGDGTKAGADTVCASSDESAGDLLAEICSKGVIRVSTDPAYPPQSSLNAETGEYEGFDIDVAQEIADRLGVDIEWETPKWEVLTAGSWNDRWDMSVGSMTPINERQEVLNFTEPYSFVPAVVVVHQDSSASDVTTDLDGKKIGVCASCTYEFFLDKSLAISGFEFDFVIDDAKITGYDTDTTALQDLALGDGTRLDAVMTSVTTAQAFIDAGNPVKIIGDPVFGEPLAIAFDKSSELDGTSLQEAVDGMVADMHADGTLTELSKKWYDGIDVTQVS